MQLDLSSAESIRKAADALQGRPIHTLINNAGVMGPPERVPSELQGLERQLAVNHMGHFLLTGLLLPNLRASTPARVINVSSNASDFGNLVMGDLGWDPAKRKFSYWCVQRSPHHQAEVPICTSRWTASPCPGTPTQTASWPTYCMHES